MHTALIHGLQVLLGLGGLAGKTVLASLGLPVMSQADMEAYVPQQASQDIIWQPLYDSGNYSTAGQVSIVFFSTPIGSGATTAPSGTGAKSLLDTNLGAQGQLTLGNSFLAVAKELYFFPSYNPTEGLYATGSTTQGMFLNDVFSFFKDGLLTFTAGSGRTYIQDGPLGLFAPQTSLATAPALGLGAVTTTGSVYLTDYATVTGVPYQLVPIYLQANLLFTETLTWGSATPLPSAQKARILSRFRGYLNRNVQ